MSAKTRMLFIVIGVVVLGIGGVIAYAALQAGNDKRTNSDTTQDTDTHSHENTDTNKDDDTSQDDTDAVAESDVMIMDYAYSPATITVKKGSTVTWVNHDDIEHTVTSSDDSPVSFDSGLFGKNETFSFTFDEAGTYQYYCTPHPYMKGTVVVTE